MEKDQDARYIRLKYKTTQKPTPQEVLAMMQEKSKHLDRCTIESVKNVSPNEVLFELGGADRTSFLDGQAIWVWAPTE